MRLDTFHGPMDIPAYAIYVLWALVSIFNIALVISLWPFRKRTVIKFVLSLLCADLVQVLISMVEAVGKTAMREYHWWCSTSISSEEAGWSCAGYSLLLLCVEVFFRSSWRRGLKRRSLRRRATLAVLLLWLVSFLLHSITIPFYKKICDPHTMEEQFGMVYKISVVSMNLLVPMAWAFLLLLKTVQNYERNLHSRDDWIKDFCMILLINFGICWIVKQMPTIVFWEYREVFTVTDNVAYVLANVRCLVDSMVVILFLGELTSLGTCECPSELSVKQASPALVTVHPAQRQQQGHQGRQGGGSSRKGRALTPPPMANVNDL